MSWKRFGKSLLFPPLWLAILLVPLSAVPLVLALVYLESSSPVAITTYLLAAYTLTVWGFRVPRFIRWIKRVKNENRLLLRWREDDRLRVTASLYGTLAWNVVYAAFQLGLGIYHRTFWFISFAVYYFFLAVMRFFLVRHARRHPKGKRMREELKKYRFCGALLLVMNLALAVIVFFMVYFGRTFRHSEITTITMAAYTFSAFALAIVNIVKYRKYHSPVYSASRVISLVAATVSVLTLESTMLETFSDGTMDALTKNLLLGISGGVIVMLIVVTAIYMIVVSTKKLKIMKEENIYGKS